MNLQEFREKLLAAGYRESEIDYTVTQFEQGTYPQIGLFHRDFSGYDQLNISMTFHTDGMNISFLKGHAGLFHVPVQHQTIRGMSSAKLEEQLLLVNWSHDHRFLMDEFPENKAYKRTATEFVPGVLRELDLLFHSGTEGKMLAEQLCVRHIAWHFVGDRNDPLHDLVGQKYYPTAALTGIIGPEALHQQLQLTPIPDLDISEHIGNFIDRQINYYSFTNQIQNIMNLNNLEDLKKEMAMLGFSPKSIDQLEPQMRTGTGYFNIKEQLPGDNGLPVEVTLHLRKSNESAYYNLNKFEAFASKIPPASPGKQYMVITANAEKPEQPLVKKFDSGLDAVEFFKKQKGDAELAVGESLKSKQLLASKELGDENFVHNDFRKAYYGSAVSQTFYVSKGTGFTAQQAANMVQGRTVYRDNMLNPASGETYKAWIKLDFEQAKDDWGNYKLKQMNDPNFGFDLDKTLNKFKIKELGNPEQKAAIVEAIKQGDRAMVTVTGKDNKDHKVQLEAQPRYKTMDFFNSQNIKLKRESYQKSTSQNLDLGKDKSKEKDKSEDLSVGVGG